MVFSPTISSDVTLDSAISISTGQILHVTPNDLPHLELPTYHFVFNSDFLQEYVLQPDSTVAVIKRQLTGTLQKALGMMAPVLGPVFDRLTQALYSSPDIVVLGFFCVILLLVFQILSWLRRALVFWTRIAFRMAFYAGLVALAASVWQRGLEASWADAVSIGGMLLKYGGWVKDTWMNEYRKYEQQGQKTRGGYAGQQAGSWRSR
ncbi:hypothetical protein CONLIGDRAFT_710648 [Coniochaeta ligniaria NRRL 30616]|uniref:Uncharacterized protein n=1 Tax=Coniochaeta ligniaria NRRL 30616 TaxID=1408157 RepID=A0A1J7JPZ7_9PEZI|nr:hypothetical protein CONLIGDRAFT_710648 [Coniochaeta ligniaria NRRL 30616]